MLCWLPSGRALRQAQENQAGGCPVRGDHQRNSRVPTRAPLRVITLCVLIQDGELPDLHHRENCRYQLLAFMSR